LGFDVIIGNPPYVRQELFGSLKTYLQTRYKSFHGVADLYVYFYELGLSLLKDGGRLGFISSSVTV
jgi:tRNA1(Val) A37 N6-methylase TrmN6